MTYKIYTLGCKVNQYDSSALGKELEKAGFFYKDKNAKIAIINTCAVTKSAISKCKRIFNKAKKENPKAKIILTGCWINIDKNIDLKADILCKRDKAMGEIKKLSCFKPENKKIKSSSASKFNLRSRYFIKVQDGCDQFCSYCIIPYARPNLESKSKLKCEKEIKQALKNGFKEIILCGIHLGKYGKDIKKIKYNLSSLLEDLLKIKNLGRIRLSSIEVNEIKNNLVLLIKKSVKNYRKNKSPYICRHLHIPLQSGNDKILKLMKRPYTVSQFEDKIRKIRKIIPEIAISTDIIVGFPGETEKDFLKTYNFAKKIKFSKIHVFPFSAHKKTPASKMKDQVDKKEKKKRVEKLRNLSVRLEKDYKNKFKNKKTEIAVEDIVNKKARGKSEFYFEEEFILKNKDIKIGDIV
jgi:threonylcarbamoyladenosine tRNA methylthiotransferase MtaB